MNDTTRPLATVGLFALSVALFFGGTRLREMTDVEARVVTPGTSSMDGLLADRDQSGSEISLLDYYNALAELVKREYVEPVYDNQKLASGAVRGMVLSLGDPRCVYMDAKEFKAYLKARDGKYEGIGADFVLRSSAPLPAAPPAAADPTEDAQMQDPRAALGGSRVPSLVVSMVVPNGPAAKAGVKPGDVVQEIDGHWVVEDSALRRFNQARKDFAAKKISYADIAKLQKELRDKAERALMPQKARNKLFLGSSGQVKVVWMRGGAARKTTLLKRPSSLPTFTNNSGTLSFRFDAQTTSKLKGSLAGRSALTLDLRNNVDGDYDAVQSALAVLVPKGTYGSVLTSKSEKMSPFAIASGNAKPPKLTLKVDNTTRGPAAVFAKALAAKGLAKIDGNLTNDDYAIREVVALPDGSGYTLVTGEYRTKAASTKVALAEGK